MHSPETLASRLPLRRRHAVMAEAPDQAVPAHYGAPLREQRRLMAGRSVVDLGQLEILEVSGPDARRWMTTISSQDLASSPVGASQAVTVLSPQGRVEHYASVIITADDALMLVVDPGCRVGWRRYLDMMRFASRVEFTDRDDLRALGSTRPLESMLWASELGIPAPVAVHEEQWPTVALGGIAYGPDPDDASPWFTSLCSADALQALAWQEEHLAGFMAAEALRVASHRPRFVREVDERSIPHELDLLRTAVHTAKGCYRGQETVAKVMNLGQPPRRLVMLHLDGSQDVAVHAGSEVFFGGTNGKLVGHLTSAALHADYGHIALAVVKRTVPLDVPLLVHVTVGEGENESLWLDAAQETIVMERDHGVRPQTARL